MKAKEIDYDLMNEWFYYDETSHSCLRWKKAGDYTSRVVVGDIAGSYTKAGERYRWRVTLLHGKYNVSRIVVCLHNKTLNRYCVVDHIDRNPSNNKISNLRVVSQKVNSRNRKLCSENSSGVTGVFFRAKDNSYVAHWRDGTTHPSRYFSINKYGEEEAFRLACQAREEAIKRLNEQGAGYTETHGKLEGESNE